MGWCQHGGSLRWWTDAAKNRFASCQICDEIIVRAGKPKPKPKPSKPKNAKKEKKEKPQQLTLFP